MCLGCSAPRLSSWTAGTTQSGTGITVEENVREILTSPVNLPLTRTEREEKRKMKDTGEVRGSTDKLSKSEKDQVGKPLRRERTKQVKRAAL